MSWSRFRADSALGVLRVVARDTVSLKGTRFSAPALRACDGQSVRVAYTDDTLRAVRCCDSKTGEEICVAGQIVANPYVPQIAADEARERRAAAKARREA